MIGEMSGVIPLEDTTEEFLVVKDKWWVVFNDMRDGTWKDHIMTHKNGKPVCFDTEREATEWESRVLQGMASVRQIPHVAINTKQIKKFRTDLLNDRAGTRI